MSSKARKTAAKAKKKKEKVRCTKLPQLAKPAPLVTPLPRFGNSVRTASKQTIRKAGAEGSCLVSTGSATRDRQFKSQPGESSWRVFPIYISGAAFHEFGRLFETSYSHNLRYRRGEREWLFLPGDDLDLTHHPAVFVLENVAVKDKLPHLRERNVEYDRCCRAFS